MMSHGTPRFGRGWRIVWPLLLVVGLTLFNSVDYDGDPTTSNGPAVVLTAGIDVCQREQEEAELSLLCEPALSGVGKRLWRRARCWQLRVRSSWYRSTSPIRGP